MVSRAHASLWLVAFAVLAAFTTTACSAEQARTFSLDMSADAEILMATHYGGSGIQTTYRLFGDGALRIVDTNPFGKHEVLGEYVLQLAPDEMHTLLAPGVQAGLMEFDYRRKQAELRAQGRRPALVADGSDFYVEISLADYRGPGNPKGGPLKHTVTVHSPDVTARTQPDVPEFVAMSTLESALFDLYKRAKAESRGEQQ